MTVLFLAAGENAQFAATGQPWPRNLVEVAGRPLIEHALQGLRPLLAIGEPMVGLIRGDEDRKHHTADVLRLLHPSVRPVLVPQLDSGAACAALLAIEDVDPDRSLLVANGDQVLQADLLSIITSFGSRDLDAGVVCFQAVHPRWSYVRTDPASGLVIEAAEKRPISNLATAGLYWFRRASDFFAGAMRSIEKGAAVDGRYYICPVLNELVLQHKRIGVAEVNRSDYWSLAIPHDVTAYEQYRNARRPTREV